MFYKDESYKTALDFANPTGIIFHHVLPLFQALRSFLILLLFISPYITFYHQCWILYRGYAPETELEVAEILFLN